MFYVLNFDNCARKFWLKSYNELKFYINSLFGVYILRKKISSGSKFEKIVGYSRAVVDGEWIFVSGTTGYDYKNDTISDDVVEQTEQCINNIKSALSEANSSLEEIIRIRVYINDNKYFLGEVGQILGKYFGDIKPANTTVVTGFVDDQIKIEIEVTARRF